MEWVSSSVEDIYKIIDKAYSVSIKKNHPFVYYLKIDPNSFNDAFISDEFVHRVKVYICADYNHEKFNHGQIKTFSKNIIEFFNDLKKIFSTNLPTLMEKYMSVELFLNQHDVCFGKLPQKNEEEISETNESEITERCWKGYTQKGMKTMFGKRYPNCVKKTKK